MDVFSLDALNSEETATENRSLKTLLETRDEEIRQLKEKFATIERENPQFAEECLLQAMNKLKSDFHLMYERQWNFFLEKIEFLKEEQRANLSKLN